MSTPAQRGEPLPVTVDAPANSPRPPDPYAHRRGEPRTFIALWIILLFSAIAMTLGGVGMLGLLSAEVYRPAAQRLLVMVMAAIVIIWPMIRLSQDAPAHPARAFLVDAIAVLVPVQAIVWPQSLPWMAAWPLQVTACLTLWIASWTLAVAGLLTWCFARGDARRFLPRWAAMCAIVAICLTAPLIEAFRRVSDADANPDIDFWLLASPLTAVLDITADRSWSGQAARVSPAHWWGTATVAGVALFLWVCAWLRSRAAGPRRFSSASPQV